ncbi:MAG: hypothetical protein WED34_15390 [Planctomycetales bacterium]
MRESRSTGEPQDIDFLPASFHQHRQRRQKAAWRRALLGVFLTLIVLGTVRQHQVRTARATARDDLRRQAAALVERLESREALQARIDRLDLRANLVAQLRLRIAPTRLLAGVSAVRPEFVSLREFRMTREQLTSAAASAPPSAAAAGSSAPVVPAEQQDLDRLARQANESAVFVHLAGIAPDDVTLSRYLIALEETGLFDEVKLLYTDEHRHGDHWLRSFRLRLRVRLPGENRPKQLEAARVARARSIDSRHEGCDA